MRTIQTLQESGADKAIHLTIPVEAANHRYRLVIAVEPDPPLPVQTPEELGWPPGYFETTFGSITDENLARAPQGELPKPVELEAKRPDPATVWAAIDAFRERLAATGRDFGDSTKDVREDRER